MNSPLTPAMEAAGLVPGLAPVPVLLPDPASVFARRAARLRQLAPGHSLEEWLLFLAGIADAQQNAADALAGTPLPTPAGGLQPEWRSCLRRLLADPAIPAPALARAEMERLAQAGDGELDALAEALLGGDLAPGQLAAVPFVAAALQVYWTRLAAGQDPASLARPAQANVCPVCGSHPVAASIAVDGETVGIRHLHCSLCHTAWHHVRAKCTACASNAPIQYTLIEGGDDKVRAETCDACHSYLKVLFPAQPGELDPTADDLASLALDLLMDESGYQRAGGNLFMLGLG